MLTPSATDPNRESELKRQKATPSAFGSDVLDAQPNGWKETPLPGVKVATSKTPAK